MKKAPKSQFVCNACGGNSPKWLGCCPDCGAWNTLEETRMVIQSKTARREGYTGVSESVQALSDVVFSDTPRISTGSLEVDRVLGGGLVQGSVVLIGGDPGIGKSTLLLQTMAHLSREKAVLYVTGEESLQQVSLRAHRLGFSQAPIKLLAETQIEQILLQAEREKPAFLVVDSIQTMYTDTLQSAPGSVSQVREAAAQLVQFAKKTHTAVFLVGHVTKEGTLAGPRVLEHMVDTVLYFEGQTDSRYRVIRAFKNRFGAVNELGIFGMTDKGLKEVSNPSAIFLTRSEKPLPGSSVMVTWEGSRPMLIELQALVDQSHAANPRRVSVGIDPNRLTMGLAVLHRHGGIVTYDQDVFVNVVGGVRVTETGSDLALMMSILSSLRNQPLPQDMVIFGEVGLGGEIRPVPGGHERLREAHKHGFTQAIVPHANAKGFHIEGMTIHACGHIQEALGKC
ncbi:MAG: DNA repair protein RadA [Gammaproteobacteria bacterium]